MIHSFEYCRVPHVEEEVLTLPEHQSSPRFFTCLSCSCQITCLYVFSSVLLCPPRFPRKNDVRFILTSICFVWEFMVYLYYMYLFTYTGVQKVRNIKYDAILIYMYIIVLNFEYNVDVLLRTMI